MILHYSSRKPIHDVFFLSLYVDDMIITGDDFYGIASLKVTLFNHFAMKDLGVLRYFLGIEVASSPKIYLLFLYKYTTDQFEHARLTNEKIVDTSLEKSVRYSSSDDVPLTDSTLYQTIVGSLVYIIVTRLNIAHVVHVVSQFV